MDGTLGQPAMARTLAYIFLAGPTLGAITLALPGADAPGLAAFVMIPLGYVIGLLLLLRPERLSAVPVPAFLAAGTILLSAGICLGGNVHSAYGVLYALFAIVAFYFLPRWQSFAQLAVATAAYTSALALLAPPEVWIGRVLVTMGAALVAGLLVGGLRDRIDGLIERLSDAARIDALTGLANRRAFEELFDLELERARRSERPLSVLVGDLDGFRHVNERLGRHKGDLALSTVAMELGKWKRRVDTAGRIGGEEFAILLPETDERAAFLVAERLRRAIQRTFGDAGQPLTMSFGIATYPAHGDQADLLLRTADQALHSAKELGRDRVVIYSEEVARTLGESRGGDHGEMQLATVLGLAEALDIRDTGTSRHSHAVARYAARLAEALGLPAERVERVRLAGLLHDVGKIGIADFVFSKPGPLDEEEWAEMRTHPQIGARLLSHPDFADLRSWVLAHHERPDGTGYPHRLPDEEIPLEAKIITVADAYEAMTADRAYRPALGHEGARSELRYGAGTQFDARVVEAFLELLEGEDSAPAPDARPVRAASQPR